jgi:hypothetical protein
MDGTPSTRGSGAVSGGSRSAGRLREELELACEDGYLMKELTVLAPKNDPYRWTRPRTVRIRRWAATAARSSPTRSGIWRTSTPATRPSPSSRARRSRRSSRTSGGWGGRSRWYSSFRSDFNVDFGVSPETPQEGIYQDGESLGLSVFFRDGDEVFRTYFTTRRGTEALGSAWTFLDLTPLGRQETWEDSPEGWPQTPPYDWCTATTSTRKDPPEPRR